MTTRGAEKRLPENWSGMDICQKYKYKNIVNDKLLSRVRLVRDRAAGVSPGDIKLPSKQCLYWLKSDAGGNYARVDGGMVSNNWLVQFLADILNTKVLRPKIEDTTALGVAFFAGYQIGEFKSLEEIKNKWKKDAIFSPKISQKQRNYLLQGWRQAIRKTLA